MMPDDIQVDIVKFAEALKQFGGFVSVTDHNRLNICIDGDWTFDELTAAIRAACVKS